MDTRWFKAPPIATGQIMKILCTRTACTARDGAFLVRCHQRQGEDVMDGGWRRDEKTIYGLGPCRKHINRQQPIVGQHEVGHTARTRTRVRR